LPKVVFNNLLQRPQLDRVFYVPFWECPYRCAFCCVDSLPGKPPRQPDAGEPMLFGLLEALRARTGRAVQVHVYGGEPLLRPDYLAALAGRLLGQPGFGKLYLYSTLRPPGIERVAAALPPGRLRVVVNPDTLDAEARARMAALAGVAELYRNPMTFPTGRGAEGAAGYRTDWLTRLLPVGLPGRSCFATVSGPLVNGAHGLVHLCCLPQSPVVGRTDEPPAEVLARYETVVAGFHREVEALARQLGVSHPCAVCDRTAGFDSRSHARKEGLAHVVERLLAGARAP
jgi:hypothetical protein